MLNGKAKEEFEKWLIEYYLTNRKDYNQFTNDSILKKHYRKTQIEQNALIIEWFDSVGIYINIENLYYQSWWSFKVKNCPKTFNEVVTVSTRHEATTKAIEKAVEIFNQLNK